MQKYTGKNDTAVYYMISLSNDTFPADLSN